MPIDPGDVLLKATAPGKKEWSLPVHLAAGPGVDHFDVPKLEDAPVETPAGGGGGTVVVTNGMGTAKILGLVLAGAGVVTAGVGAVFHITALSQDSKANQVDSTKVNSEIAGNQTLCNAKPPDSKACPNAYTRYTDHQAAVSDQNIAIGLYGGGGALLIAGVILFFTASPSTETKKADKGSFQVVPTVGLGQSGLTLVGTF